MADHHPQYIPNRILQAGVEKSVSEKLGSLSREFGEFTKGMTMADVIAAKLMLLEMVRNACNEFYAKMKVRIEREKQAYTEQMEAHEGLPGSDSD